MIQSISVRSEYVDGVVVLTLDDHSYPFDSSSTSFEQSFELTVERLETEKDTYTGVVVTSAERSACSSSELNEMGSTAKETPRQVAANVRAGMALLRRLETLGRPIVAAMSGSLLGCDLEIALASHHRIVVDDLHATLGFPEVGLGLMPSAGGIARTVRMFGVVDALTGLLLKGQQLSPRQALKMKLVDKVVPTRDDLIPAAKQWIASVVDENVTQPWDASNYQIPGGTPATPALAENLPAIPAILRKAIKGANYPAPHHIMAAAVEGAQVDFESATRIEERYFVDLVFGQVSKNMIQAFCVDLRAVRDDSKKYARTDPFFSSKVVVLGAGMTGSGLAYEFAKAGFEVVLKDVALDLAERGKTHAGELVARSVEHEEFEQSDGQRLLDRIVPTDAGAPAIGAELVIEAVSQDPRIKVGVLANIEPYLAERALFGSTTWNSPISDLTEGLSRPADFIGLHFFSPVDKLPLLEIVKGSRTSETTLQRAHELALRLDKTPLVVTDSPGFFVTRLVVTAIHEAIAMLAEGVPAPSIEQAAMQSGFPTPFLEMADELNLESLREIRGARTRTSESPGNVLALHPAELVIDRMIVDYGRSGRVAGAGFYEYEVETRTRLWRGLRDAFGGDSRNVPLADLKDRILFVMVLEAAKCLDEGVIGSVAAANIGSILGAGFPGWTGGVLQYVNGYEGGTGGFISRAHALYNEYGERFLPSASLLELGRLGQIYQDQR
jgi:3-hydroxyacyl-CoA dehydrogenase/enoyl-CoA hydratase/3-hydroxybutyryl-CoA epimerase